MCSGIGAVTSVTQLSRGISRAYVMLAVRINMTDFVILTLTASTRVPRPLAIGVEIMSRFDAEDRKHRCPRCEEVFCVKANRDEHLTGRVCHGVFTAGDEGQESGKKGI